MDECGARSAWEAEGLTPSTSPTRAFHASAAPFRGRSRGEGTHIGRGLMDANRDVQGYCLSAEESRALRFPTALCLAVGLGRARLITVVSIATAQNESQHAWRAPS
jgi:hypothetical protein